MVIGSGPNGLAAAIRLAEAGMDVTVFERSDVAGGAVRTEELTLPGFAHDTCSAVYPAAAASPAFRRLELGQHGLEWSHPGVCVAHVLGDGHSVALYRDLGRTVESLEAACTGDGQRWRRHVEPLVEHMDQVRAAVLGGFPPVRGAVALAAPHRLPAALRLATSLTAPATELARSLFRSPGARAWLCGMAMHSSPPTARGGALAAVYLAALGHAVGWPSPVGGAGRLADALVSCLRTRGGRVVTGAEVQAVDVRGGAVHGVRLRDGQAHPCDVVVADVLPHALVALAGDALPWRYRRRLEAYTMGAGTWKVDWALDGPIPWASADARAAGTVHVGGSEDELLATAESAARELPERPFLLLGQQSLADPTRAPEGKHTAWAYAHAPAGIAARQHLQLAVDRIEAQVERFAPGFRDRILARSVAGPDQLHAIDANLVDGDVGAGAYDLRQLTFRPLVAASPYRTPVEGLYLGSAATFPGGGVHGVCGDAAAQCAVRDVSSSARRRAGRVIASLYC